MTRAGLCCAVNARWNCAASARRSGPAAGGCQPALRFLWVLADRFELSTWAYQGGGRHLDRDMIAHLSSFCLHDFKPDLIIFLDISPEQGLKRVKKRGKVDRIEQESLAFFSDVYNSYHEQIKTLRNIVVIDASKPLVVVQNLIREALEQYMQTL